MSRILFNRGAVHLGVIAILIVVLVAVTSFGVFADKESKGRDLSNKIRCRLDPSAGKCQKDDKGDKDKPSPLPSSSPLPSEPPTSNDTRYDMKVLVVKYFPLKPGTQEIDINVTGDVSGNYIEIRQNTIDYTNYLITALHKASFYLLYKDPSAEPSLTYSVVDTKEFTQAVPMLKDGTRRPNYAKILKALNICNYVESSGVNEVWMWAYQGPTYPGSQDAAYLSISESKMAGPFGDISNILRTNDMPICAKTYRVYTFNYGRGPAEALEAWGHQLEAELDAVDSYLFRNVFQGPNYPQTLDVNGRCGSVHNPPNARGEYDQANNIGHPSDCLDWDPDGYGNSTNISCLNWGCEIKGTYDNPGLNYQIWNWQNLPGRKNNKTYNGKRLRNWWDVHGDFDNVMRSNRRLTLEEDNF